MATTTVVSLALLLTSLLQADAVCVTKKAGDTIYGYPVHLQQVELSPPYTSWDVHVWNPCAPQQKVGLMTTICDRDSGIDTPPDVDIVPFDHIIVNRHDKPYPIHNASVDITIYCTFVSQPSENTVDIIKAVPVQ